jgi:hypothetical protein
MVPVNCKNEEYILEHAWNNALVSDWLLFKHQVSNIQIDLYCTGNVMITG